MYLSADSVYSKIKKNMRLSHKKSLILALPPLLYEKILEMRFTFLSMYKHRILFQLAFPSANLIISNGEYTKEVIWFL